MYVGTVKVTIFAVYDWCRLTLYVYFSRLTLPGRIVEDGREKATFDIDKGRLDDFMTHTTRLKQ